MRRALLLSLWLSLLASGRSAAQTCLGMPSFAHGRMYVAPGVSFAEGATSYGGSVGYGAPRSFYGSAGFATTDYDDLAGSADNLNFSAGYQVPVAMGRAELCPLASLSLGWGPNDQLGPGVDVSNRTVAAGAAFGLLVATGSQVQLVPNASFLLASTRLTLDDGTQSASDSEGYGALTLGTGLVFASRYSLNPTVTIPVGLSGADPSFGLTAGIHFGR
jgi:hypothetical protein